MGFIVLGRLGKDFQLMGVRGLAWKESILARLTALD